jgi:NAD(P)-dependent dehydrogenase (short-subunit alcohol dehydrogenase family)
MILRLGVIEKLDAAVYIDAIEQMENMNMTKTVLITGCSSGLGKSAARHFAAQGWNVIATMRKIDQSLAIEHPDRILVAELDVADPASI